MIRRPPRSTPKPSSAASDVYKRQVTDAELAALDVAVVVYPSLIENQVHQRQTLMGILATVTDSFMVQGSPEPPDDDFPNFLDAFVTMVEEFGRVEHDD